MNIYESLENLNVSEECFNDIMGLVEEIINEVSVGALARAVENNHLRRKEQAKGAREYSDKTWDKYDKISRKKPEAEPMLYRYAEVTDSNATKAEERAEHADDLKNDLSKHKNSKLSANRLFKAAQKVRSPREDKFSKAVNDNNDVDGEKASKALQKSINANRLAYEDPVKSRRPKDDN